MMPFPIRLSVVFTVYNEDYYIESSLSKAISLLETLVETFEIIVVDDGSSDRSGHLLDAFTEKDRRVRVIHNDINLHQGCSILRGLYHAKYEYITLNGIDLLFDFSALTKAFPLLDEFDFVVFERAHRKNIPMFRNVISYFYGRFMHSFFHSKVNDFNFGLLLKNEAVKRSLPKVISRSPALSLAELVLRMEVDGYTCQTIPEYPQIREKGESQMGKPHVILWSLYDLLRLKVVTWLTGW